MRKSLIFSLAGLFLSTVVASLPAQTQEKNKSATKPAGNSGVDSTRKAADVSKDAKDYRRVPQYFGQVDLSDEQREKIYGIREKYAIQQAKLEEELASMQDKIMRECEAVLSPEQRNELIKLRGEAKAKAKAKSKAKSATKKG